MKTLIIVTTCCLIALNGFNQSNTRIDTSKYRAGKTIWQNGCKLTFWQGSVSETKYSVLVEQKFKSHYKLFVMNPAMNGEYSLADKNHDGFLDFTTNYHGYDIIYLFNKTQNRFEEHPIHISEKTKLIDKTRNVYWSYREAQYADHRSFSVLYQFQGNKLLEKFKIVYETNGDDDYDKVVRIDLYRIPTLENHKEIFVKTIKSKNPMKFKYQNYWRKNYMKLLGFR